MAAGRGWGPEPLGVSRQQYGSSTTSPVSALGGGFRISPVGTLERSRFLRFRSGPSPKHHRVGEDPALGTHCPCVPEHRRHFPQPPSSRCSRPGPRKPLLMAKLGGEG